MLSAAFGRVLGARHVESIGVPCDWTRIGLLVDVSDFANGTYEVGHFQNRQHDPRRPSKNYLPVVAARVSHWLLRHTTASLVISAGANVKTVQRILGHPTVAMTRGLHGHLLGDLNGVFVAVGEAIESTALSLLYEGLNASRDKLLKAAI
jgi:hypothetical protein